MTVRISKPEALAGSKWISNKHYGRAYFKGYYEPEITEYLIESLQDSDVFYDVGAHCGYFSLLASKICKEGSIVSFEPFPPNFDFLNKIRNLNYTERWAIVNKAISNVSGQIGFQQGKTTSTGKVSNDSSFLVDKVNLDTFIAKTGLTPTVIKIDVEGHADKVLEGFRTFELLPNCRLLIELHENSNERSYIIDRFRKKYRILNIKGQESNLEKERPSHVLIEALNT